MIRYVIAEGMQYHSLWFKLHATLKTLSGCRVVRRLQAWCCFTDTEESNAMITMSTNAQCAELEA